MIWLFLIPLAVLCWGIAVFVVAAFTIYFGPTDEFDDDEVNLHQRHLNDYNRN